MSYEQTWVAVGLIGQFMFTGRFVVQWLSSERNKKVTIPRAFWFLSIAGSLMLLSYAIHRRDLVFTIGQSSGLFIYLRNLQLNLRESRSANASASSALAQSPAAQNAASIASRRDCTGDRTGEPLGEELDSRAFSSQPADTNCSANRKAAA